MIKSLDKSEKIRRTVFKRLLDEDFKFHCFKEDDRIQLIMNGLKDPDEKVVTYCKQYLQAQICAKKDEKPKILGSDLVLPKDEENESKK